MDLVTLMGYELYKWKNLVIFVDYSTFIYLTFYFKTREYKSFSIRKKLFYSYNCNLKDFFKTNQNDFGPIDRSIDLLYIFIDVTYI